MPVTGQLEQVPFDPGARLPEVADVWWRKPVDTDRLAHIEWLSAAFTSVYVAPFFVLGALLVTLEPLLAAVSLLCLVHAWVIPELFAHPEHQEQPVVGARTQHQHDHQELGDG